ncbi:unnamed protein product [Paramecium pentaurelia]|uniref:Uncharacterized protein n=1 Tax=Paramecium pentaurelia TaxID=43138 RepID=A0A8S1YJB0_9CILI|nr:unnamed protein product [Paramecium pentaurelia]
MESVEQYTEKMRTLTQQCIKNFNQFKDESYYQVNGFIDSIYYQLCLKPAPEQKKDHETSYKLAKLPDPTQVKIDMIVIIHNEICQNDLIFHLYQ